MKTTYILKQKISLKLLTIWNGGSNKLFIKLTINSSLMYFIISFNKIYGIT